MIDEHNFVWYKYCERRDMNISKSNTYSVQTLSCYAMSMCGEWYRSLFVGCSSTTHNRHTVLCSIAMRCGRRDIYIYIVFQAICFKQIVWTPCTFLSPWHVQNSRKQNCLAAYTMYTRMTAWVLFFCFYPNTQTDTNLNRTKTESNPTQKYSIRTISKVEWSDLVWKKVPNIGGYINGLIKVGIEYMYDRIRNKKLNFT